MAQRLKSRKGKRGFTLVELIISFAILAVVALIAALIVRAGGRTYSGISTDINLQYESQLAMSQIQDYVIDCNAYIAADSSGLYVFNRIDDVHYEAFKIARSSTTDELYLYNKTINAVFDPTNAGNFAFGDSQLMSSYVIHFAAAVDTDADSSTDAVSVKVTIDYGAGSKEFTGTQTIALRNTVTKISVPIT